MSPTLTPSLATATTRDSGSGHESSRTFVLLAPDTMAGVDAVFGTMDGEPEAVDRVCDALREAFSKTSGSREVQRADREELVAGRLSPIPLDGVSLVLAVQIDRNIVCASQGGRAYACTATTCSNLSESGDAPEPGRRFHVSQFAPALDDCLVLVSGSAAEYVTQSEITETSRGFTDWFREQDAADWLALLARGRGGSGVVAIARFVPHHVARKAQRSTDDRTADQPPPAMLIAIEPPPEPAPVLQHARADSVVRDSPAATPTTEPHIEREIVPRSREADTDELSTPAPLVTPPSQAPRTEMAGAGEGPQNESPSALAARRRFGRRRLVALPILAVLVLGGLAAYALRPAPGRHHAAPPSTGTVSRPPRPAPVARLQPPGAPSIVQSDATLFTVSWTRVSGADHYIVHLDGRTERTAAPPSSVTASLLPGSTHAWRVDAVSSAGRIAASPSVRVRVRPMPAAAWSFQSVTTPATDALLTLYNSTAHPIGVHLHPGPSTTLSADSVRVPSRSSAEVGVRPSQAPGSAPALGVTVQADSPILVQRVIFAGTTTRTEYGTPVSVH